MMMIIIITSEDRGRIIKRYFYPIMVDSLLEADADLCRIMIAAEHNLFKSPSPLSLSLSLQLWPLRSIFHGLVVLTSVSLTLSFFLYAYVCVCLFVGLCLKQET